MGTNRVLVQDADSISQRSAYEREQSDSEYSWREDYAGQFRTAILYSKNLLLTDSQIFDGPVMLELGPRGLAEMLGTMHRTTEVIVALRAPTAEESLSRMLKQSRFLKRSNFVSQLEDLGWSPELIASRRQAWVRAINAGKFTVSQWPSATDFNFMGTLTSRLAESKPALNEPVVDELLTVAARSVALKKISDARLTTKAASEITVWWDSSYMDTIAKQHGGTWMSSARAESDTTNTATDGRVLRTSSSIPGVVTSRVAELSGPAFAVLRSDALSVLNAYDKKPSRGNRFRLGVAVLDATRSSKPITELVFTTLRVLSWAVVALFAFAPPEDSFRGYAWLFAVIAALLQAPVTDVLAVVRFMFRSNRTFVRTPL